jgi:Aminotransferase class-V
LTHATAACVAGGNPDLHVRIPDLRGFPRDEAVIPKHSRNVYDAALRAVGVRVIEVATVAELEAALGPRVALVYILAGPQAEAGPLTTRVVCDAARSRGVPVLVDAAAEILTVPNVHLQNGATLVAYSGGKCLRGPQTAGILLGRKDLVQAAWVHSAPHHGFARSMKVGKEEAIGMLTAVEMWIKRDHAGEWAQWTAWLDAIAKRVGALDGVRTEVVQPEGLSNKTPSLQILWDSSRFGITGPKAASHLFDTDPRVAVFAAKARNKSETGLSVTPYMLAAGEERIVADRIHALLSSPPRVSEGTPSAPTTDLTGQWDVRIEYAAGSSRHALHLVQKEGHLSGSHQGDFVSRDLTGSIEGDLIKVSSDYPESNGDALSYTFSGQVKGEGMSGTLDLGEYRAARWTATRRVHGQG